MKSPKNYEVEIKLRVARKAGLLKQLERLHARQMGRVHESNVLMDTSRRALTRTGRLLRFRIVTPLGRRGNRGSKAGGAGLLTYKAPAGTEKRYKVREEIEIPLPEHRNVGPLLEGLGLHPWFRYEKYRTSFHLPGFSGLHLELDETPIGTFLELEGPRRSIDRVAKLLGFRHRDSITANYFTLYRAQCLRKGVPVGNMLFSEQKR